MYRITYINVTTGKAATKCFRETALGHGQALEEWNTLTNENRCGRWTLCAAWFNGTGEVRETFNIGQPGILRHS